MCQLDLLGFRLFHLFIVGRLFFLSSLSATSLCLFDSILAQLRYFLEVFTLRNRDNGHNFLRIRIFLSGYFDARNLWSIVNNSDFLLYVHFVRLRIHLSYLQVILLNFGLTSSLSRALTLLRRRLGHQDHSRNLGLQLLRGRGITTGAHTISASRLLLLARHSLLNFYTRVQEL